MSPRPGGDVSNSSEFATMGSGEYRSRLEMRRSAAALALRVASEHTGLVLLLTFIAVTVVARFQELWFFQFFRVNILNYSGVQDFLFASMRTPVVWLYFILPAIILLLISWLLARGRSDVLPPREMRQGTAALSWNTAGLRLTLGVLVIVGVAAGLARMNALRRFESARDGRGRHVTFARTDGVTYNERPILLGSNGNFFFLYYAQRKVTEIVPVENTALMTVDLRPSAQQNPVVPSVSGADSTPPL